MSVVADAALQARIDALQAQSVAQEAETFRYFGERGLELLAKIWAGGRS